MNKIQPPKKNGRFILLCFLGFFLVFGSVDAFFVYTALSTNPGVVTEQPYEKGLAYNMVLEKAKNQPKLIEEISYKDGIFQWIGKNNDGTSLNNPKIDVKFYRSVKDDYDFNTILLDKGDNVYANTVKFPLLGLWTAKVNAQWNNKTYQSSHQFMVE